MICLKIGDIVCGFKSMYKNNKITLEVSKDKFSVYINTIVLKIEQDILKNSLMFFLYV